MASDFSTLEALTLSENTNVCLWCPTPGGEDLLVAGTYQLLPESGTRVGSLHAWAFSQGAAEACGRSFLPYSSSSDAASPTSARVVSSEASSALALSGAGEGEGEGAVLAPLPLLALPHGVFEACWAPPAASCVPRLATALTDGTVRIYSVPDGKRGVGEGDVSSEREKDKEASTERSTDDRTTFASSGSSSGSSGWAELFASAPLGSDESVLACCVDWCRHDPARLVASTSEGGLVVLQIPEGAGTKRGAAAASLGASAASSLRTGALPLVVTCSTSSAHSLEAWAASCGFSAHDLWSGGDDASLLRWDDRAGLASPVSRDARAFGAGVTCIAPHPTVDHLLAVGSYDERVRLFDARALRSPLSEAHADGGGVWRARWREPRPDEQPGVWWLALACMQAGQAVAPVHVTGGRTEGAVGAGAAVDEDKADRGEGPLQASIGELSFYHRQKSLAYGIDWKRAPLSTLSDASTHSRGPENATDRPPAPPAAAAPLPSAVRGSVLASCSFYDNSLDVWRL